MLMTASPTADAERWANEQDRREASAEQLKARALSMLQADIAGLTPTGWFKKLDSAAHSMDDILCEFVDHDTEVATAFAEVMTGDSAQKLRQLLIARHADQHHLVIVPTDD